MKRSCLLFDLVVFCFFLLNLCLGFIGSDALRFISIESGFFFLLFLSFSCVCVNFIPLLAAAVVVVVVVF